MNIKLYTKSRICDFCRSKLTFNYKPVKTKRNNLTFQCINCNLLQSIPQKKYKQRPPPSMSCNADRSSVKFAKGLALKKHINFFKKHKVKFTSSQKILDIGSNREFFINYLSGLKIRPEITAVETDKNLLNNYKKRKNIIKLNKRFELCNLKKNYYDFIYCSHTLEHMSSCSLALNKIYNFLNTDGLAFIAVPNINNFQFDSFEEMFIDTHTYHFTNNSLLKYFEKYNLSVVERNLKNNEIQYLVQKNKSRVKKKKFYSKKNIFFDKKMFLKKYSGILTKNREKIKDVCKKLNKTYNKNIIFWGAGRYFDAFIQIGNLDRKKITCLFDTYLYRYFSSINGVKLYKPVFKKKWINQQIFISSREYQKEIMFQAKNLGYRKFIKYKNFFREYEK